MIRPLFICLITALILIAMGFWIDSSEKRQMLGELRSAVQESSCARLGGEISKVCMSGRPLCLVEYSDAGETCLSSFQCQGECQVGEDKWSETFSLGRCSSSNNPCGCRAGVEFGMVSRGRCTD